MKFLVLSMFFLCVAAFAAADIRPVNLRCESLVNPLAVETLEPRLSWMLESGERAQRQTAYQILVGSDEKKLRANSGDLWDSGKVMSDESLHIAYAGRKLEPLDRCWWKVRAWDRDGKVSPYSKPARWDMGMLNPRGEHITWIGRTTDINVRPAPMFRKEFRVKGPIQRATAYISGLGYYDLRLNGLRVGDQRLDPGYTRYDRRVLYAAHDVTKLLRNGDNAAAVVLGSGWYNFHPLAVWNFDKAPWRGAPKFFLQLLIRYKDGTTETIESDDHWKTSTGPILYESVYSGETYDARLEKPGWDKVGYEDKDWQPALIVSPPGGTLASQMMPPIRVTRTLKPARILEPSPGVYVVDFGQNLSGWVEMTVKGAAGTEVMLKFGEKIKLDGNIDRSNLDIHMIKTNPPQRFQTDVYVLKGGGTEKWEPSFEYSGFQYVEVTGFPGKPTIDRFRAKFCHSAVEPVGEFSSSNELLNKIWEAGRWAYLSNLQSIPTDCPHREKNGWTGDAHLACEQGLFNYDSATVYAKWIDDLNDEQRPNGVLPGIVPTGGWGYAWGNGPAWDSAYLLVPWYVYLYSGDKRILTDHYEGFKKYVDYLTTQAKEGIVSIGLGDWAPWKTETPTAVTSTGYYYQDALIVAKTAEMLGKTEEAKKYRELAAGIRKGFNDRFVNRETGNVANGSQTALSCALFQNLLDSETRPKALARLVEAVEKTGGHIDTGILGAKYILHALTDMGRADLAYAMASKETQPGWGWWIKQGATTLWEQWNGNDSRNHIMYGDILAWFTQTLAGINPDPSSPGFKRFVIKPHLFDDGARFTYRSVRGKVSAACGRFREGVLMFVEIPVNTSATVFVPAKTREAVRIHEDLGSVDRPRFVRMEAGYAVYEAGSGSYTFIVDAPK